MGTKTLTPVHEGRCKCGTRWCTWTGGRIYIWMVPEKRRTDEAGAGTQYKYRSPHRRGRDIAFFSLRSILIIRPHVKFQMEYACLSTAVSTLEASNDELCDRRRRSDYQGKPPGVHSHGVANKPACASITCNWLKYYTSTIPDNFTVSLQQNTLGFNPRNLMKSH